MIQISNIVLHYYHKVDIKMHLCERYDIFDRKNYSIQKQGSTKTEEEKKVAFVFVSFHRLIYLR